MDNFDRALGNVRTGAQRLEATLATKDVGPVDRKVLRDIIESITVMLTDLDGRVRSLEGKGARGS